MKKIILLSFMLLSFSSFAQTKATQKLFSAIEKNNLNLAQIAIQDGADVNGVDREEAPTNRPLIRAVQLNRLEIVKLLLTQHADVNTKRPIDQHTALMVAANKDLASIAKVLIDNGADVNAESVFSRTALHIAALKNSLSVAKLLVETKDMDVNIRPSICAMAVAARQNNASIVLLLKKQTGSKAASPVCLDSAINMAQQNDHKEVLAILQRD